MIIDFDSAPNRSIYYTSARLYSHMKKHGCDSLENLHFFETEISDNQLLYFYSLDWLLLMNTIRKTKGGYELCD